MIFKKKEEEKTIEEKTIEEKSCKAYILSLTYRSQVTETFTVRDRDEEFTSPIQPFLRFHKWFFSKSSPYYTWWHQNGFSIILRSEILHVSVKEQRVGE